MTQQVTSLTSENAGLHQIIEELRLRIEELVDETSRLKHHVKDIKDELDESQQNNIRKEKTILELTN